ncbi:MAG: hypothetical protein WC817_01370 [Patescibacteria group bacterium]|jgi:hypothetical protein
MMYFDGEETPTPSVEPSNSDGDTQTAAETQPVESGDTSAE